MAQKLEYGSTFEKYVSNTLGGTPFYTDDPGWVNHLNSTLSRTSLNYKGVNKALRNSFGQACECEIGFAFLGDEEYRDCLPNAMATCVEDKQIIVVSMSAFTHFWMLAAQLMGCEEFLPMIGDSSLGAELEMGEKSPFGFRQMQSPHFTDFAFLTVAMGPRCPIRSKFVFVLRELMLEAVINHEMGHIHLGHVDYTREKLQASLLMEHSVQGSIGAPKARIFRALMEYEADSYACLSMITRMTLKQRFGLESEFDLSDVEWMLIHNVAIGLVAHTWWCCDSMLGYAKVDQDRKDWTDYPPSYARMFLAGPSYHTAAVDRAGVDAAVLSTMIPEFLKQMDRLSRQYQGLVGLSLALDTHITMEHLHKLENYLHKTDYLAQMSTYRYRAQESSDEERSGTTTNYILEQINSVKLPAKWLSQVLDAYDEMSPEDRTSFINRSMRASEISQGWPEKDGLSWIAYGFSATYRLEGLFDVIGIELGEDSLRIAMGEYGRSDLLKVTGTEPMVAGANGRVTFDARRFQVRLRGSRKVPGE